MTQQNKIPVWIDCDPGQDDIIAIALAAYNPNINLLGISTSHGNVPLKHTTSNTLRFLTAIGKTGTPVFPGSSQPLSGDEAVTCPEVHGKTGLNGSKLLPKALMQEANPEEFFPNLKNAIDNHEGEINIVAVGPLTNMALFFKQHPDYKHKIKYLSIMGAGFKSFNKNGNTEFNIIADPKAAHQVLSDQDLSERILLAPLDVTNTTTATKERRESILNNKLVEEASNFRTLMFQLIDYFYNRIKQRKGPDYLGPGLHDPVAVAAVLHFNNNACDFGFEYEQRQLEVLYEQEDQKGVVVVKSVGAGVKVLTKIDSFKFWKVLLDTYEEIDKVAYINTVSRESLESENE